MTFFTTTHNLDTHLVNYPLEVIAVNLGHILACQQIKRQAMNNARKAYYKATDYGLPLETHEIEKLLTEFAYWLGRAKTYSKHIRGCRAYLATGIA